LSARLLEAKRLAVRLGGAVVLRDVSLEVAKGEVLGVFGPSGAGKSTLFRALAGEERLTAGTVRIEGRDVTALPLFQRARLGLGYLPQTPSVLWDLTVAENLTVYCDLGRPAGESPRGASRGTARAPDLRVLAASLGLDARLGVAASALSGGERRRLELARALSMRPRVLLCDEPFAAIDPIGAAKVAARLAAHAAEGFAIVLADHNVTEALRLCHRAILLLEGEIAVSARPEDFARDPSVARFYAPPR
jgi:lipopolysaccharide export system ATP-binding protein